MTAPGWLSEAQLQRLLNLIRGTTALPWFVAGMPWNDSRTAVYGNCDNAMNDPHGARLVTDCDVTDEWTDGEPDGSIEDRSNALLIAEGMSALPTLIAMARSALELREQAETERLRLAVCGVAAHGGDITGTKDEYLSASLRDVLRLRVRVASAEQERDRYKSALERIMRAPDASGLTLSHIAEAALRPDPKPGEEST